MPECDNFMTEWCAARNVSLRERLDADWKAGLG